MDYCKTCVYYPPSSCDGKPCTQCDPTSAFHTCYREKEFVVDFYKEHKQTNADRIRSMMDEEMAEWLVHKTEGNGFDGYEEVVNAWLEWLKQEAKE